MSKVLRISPDLKLPADTVTSTIVVYGGKGMGKTNLGAVIVEELAAARLRFSVIDPMGVWWGLRHSEDGKGPGIEVLILGGIHGDIPIEPTAGAVVADLVVDEDANVVIDISRRPDGTMWSISERIRFVTAYAKRLYQRQGEKRRPVMQLIDEAARFAPQTVRQGESEVAACMGAVAVIVEEGRNVGIGVTLITQRSARLNKDVAELADCMVAFRVVGPNSMQAVLAWLGEHVEKKRLKDFTEKLRALPRGSALVVSPGWLEFEGIVPMRMRETFDSSATPKSGQERRASGPGAKPDLAKYRERMAETIEKAKADDPRELKKRIAELERQAATTSAPATKGKATDPKLGAVVRRLQKAVEEAMKFIVTINAEGFFKAGGEAVDRAQVQKAIDAAVANVTKMLDAKVEHRNREIERLRKEAGRILANLKALASDDVAVEVAVKHNEPFTVSSTPRPRHPVPRATTTDGPLPKGEAAILTAAAQHSNGVTREQLTVLTGYKRSSRDTYLQRLRERGLVAEEGDRIGATAEGLAALGPDFAPLPTGAQLLDHWRQKLPTGEKAVLEVVVGAWPEPVDRERISELTQYQRSSRDTYLQRLRSRQLVTEAGRGQVRASDQLFEGGAT